MGEVIEYLLCSSQSWEDEEKLAASQCVVMTIEKDNGKEHKKKEQKERHGTQLCKSRYMEYGSKKVLKRKKLRKRVLIEQSHLKQTEPFQKKLKSGKFQRRCSIEIDKEKASNIQELCSDHGDLERKINYILDNMVTKDELEEQLERHNETLLHRFCQLFEAFQSQLSKNTEKGKDECAVAPDNSTYSEATGPSSAIIISDDHVAQPTILRTQSTSLPMQPTVHSEKLTTKPILTLQPTSLPQKPTLVPQKGTFIPPKATFIPPKATFIPPKTTFIPPKATFIPPKATFIPPKPTLIPSKPKSLPAKTTATPPKPTAIPPKPTATSQKPTYVLLKHISKQPPAKKMEISPKQSQFSRSEKLFASNTCSQPSSKASRQPACSRLLQYRPPPFAPNVYTTSKFPPPSFHSTSNPLACSHYSNNQPITLQGPTYFIFKPSMQADHFFINNRQISIIPLIQESLNRGNFAVKLIRELFSDEELKNSNVYGTQMGKKPLDPQRIHFIKTLAFQYYQAEEAQRDTFWARAVNQINDMLRHRKRNCSNDMSTASS